jgi:outer membrane biosynthesis protein TonB
VKLFGVLALAVTPLAAPLLGCGGCPRRGAASSVEVEENETLQEVAAHETPDHVVRIDTPFVLEDADDPVAPGPLSAEAVHRVFVAEAADLRRCYERALSEHAGLAGTLVLELAITAEGTVRSAQVVESTLDEGLVTDCIAAEVRLWHFPSSSGEVHVRYPLELRATLPATPPPE